MPLIATIFPYSAISPEKWDNFISHSPQGNGFAFYQYMGIIAPNWEAVIISEEDTWLAVMPFCQQKKMGVSFALQPLIAQHWGIFLADIAFKNDYEAFSMYRKVVSAVIEKFPKIAVFRYHFSPFFPYPIPFHQAGYTLRTRYTYHLSLSKTEKELWENLASPLQRQIKKTQKQSFTVQMCQEKDIEALIGIFSQNQDMGKNLTGLSKKHFQPILNKLTQIAHYFIQEKKGIILTIADENGNIEAGGIFGLCGKKMTYIAGGVSPKYRTEGLMSRLLWEAILFGQKNNYTIFDFEGSMIAGIETFFRKFGAFPVPYLQIVQNQLPKILQWISIFKF